jgi:hypothetical protein
MAQDQRCAVGLPLGWAFGSPDSIGQLGADISQKVQILRTIWWSDGYILAC